MARITPTTVRRLREDTFGPRVILWIILNDFFCEMRCCLLCRQGQLLTNFLRGACGRCLSLPQLTAFSRIVLQEKAAEDLAETERRRYALQRQREALHKESTQAQALAVALARDKAVLENDRKYIDGEKAALEERRTRLEEMKQSGQAGLEEGRKELAAAVESLEAEKEKLKAASKVRVIFVVTIMLSRTGRGCACTAGNIFVPVRSARFSCGRREAKVVVRLT